MDTMTIPQAAQELNVSPKTIRRWIDTNRLKATKIKGKYQIEYNSIMAMSKAGNDSISGSMSTFDPVHHVVIEREKWEGLLVRLGQLEAENKNYQKLLEDKRPWWKKIIRR